MQNLIEIDSAVAALRMRKNGFLRGFFVYISVYLSYLFIRSSRRLQLQYRPHFSAILTLNGPYDVSATISAF